MRGVVAAVVLAGWCTGCEAILGFGETAPPELGDANSGTKDVGTLTGPEDAGSHETRSSDTADTSSNDVGIDLSLDPDVRSDASIDLDARDAAAENISDVDSSVADVSHENDVARDRDGAAEEVHDVANDVDPSDPKPEDVLSDIPEPDTATPDADVPNDAPKDDASRDVSDVTDGPPEEAPDEAGWSPQDLSYLTLWLDGARGIEGDGGAINSWLDQSPHHHRAVAANPLAMPTAVSQGIGLYPGVAFAGIGDVLQVADAPSLQYGTRDYLIEVVLRHSTPLNSTHCDNLYGAIYLKQIRNVAPFRGAVLFANTPETPTPDAIFHAGIDGLNFTQSPVGTAYNDDVPRLVGMYRRGNVLSLRVNGFQIAAVTTPMEGGAPLNVDANGYDLFLGGQPNPTQCLHGVIGELVAASPVRPDEMVAVETYLLTKHAAALARDP